ncbi:hypothetical protein KP509_16G045900 [Ceratopteris richardii]|nr:hypothetical protein KP509_16G045900 [Ceratopteris richardii]
MDVENTLRRFGLLAKDVEEALHKEGELSDHSSHNEGSSIHGDIDNVRADPAADRDPRDKESNGLKDKALVSSGGALVLAILCNKALLPVRVPLTIALTPPIARFLARRKLYHTG